ncbi:MAG: energy transducer TonB family protein [Bryobacteraceae bacterium]
MAVRFPPAAGEQQLALFARYQDTESRRRALRAGSISIGLHVALVCLLAFTPLGGVRVHDVAGIVAQLKEPVTLVAPPKELTQKAPNRGQIGKEFNLESLLPRPRVFVPPSAPPGAPPAGKPAPLPEPPKIDALIGPLAPGSDLAFLPPPQIQPADQPKLVLEPPPKAPEPRPGGSAKLALPKTSVTEMGQALAKSGVGTGLIVSDFGDGLGGIGGGINISPVPGAIGNSLELLSDPQGVDFKPYLVRILSAVRRNWLAIIPESARRGRQGRVVIHFAIDRDGKVPKLVIASGSGTDALDRAAVAGISATTPFPPLPAEFTGKEIRLQFVFLYNLRPY